MEEKQKGSLSNEQENAEDGGYIEEEDVKIRKGTGVFYNPMQKFTRTLTVRVINAYLRGRPHLENPSILECMSATGLRGIRYCKEIEGRKHVVLNDFSQDVCRTIMENCRLNGINAELDETCASGEGSTIEVRNMDCRVLMYKNPASFDVIDLDPFGTCAPYIESCFEAIKDGGLLCVTSTDAKVLCDKPPESPYKYYGVLSCNGPASHEIAVRTVLSYASRIASKFGKRVTPLISLSIDFFIRVFLLVERDGNGSKEVALDNSMYFLCSCQKAYEQKMLERETPTKYRHSKLVTGGECGLCGRRMCIYGPFWNGAMQDKEFIRTVLASIDQAHVEDRTRGNKENLLKSEQVDRRMHGMLSMVEEEENTFLYYKLSGISSILSLPSPPLVKIISVLLTNGYKVSQTHCKSNSIKTDAPIEVVYKVVIEYFGHDNAKNREIYEKFLKKISGSGEERGRGVPKRGADQFQYVRHIYRRATEVSEERGVKFDYELTKDAKFICSKRYLKFQDASGLNWGPMKRGSH